MGELTQSTGSKAGGPKAGAPNAGLQAEKAEGSDPQVSSPASTTTGSHESDTRTRLLEAAGPVFAAKGFDGATIREICSSAGLNVASVGYHFGDKLGLYREVIREIRESRERRFPTPDNPGGEPRQVLHGIVRNLLSRMLVCDESGWETQLLMREMHQPTPVFETMVREFFSPQFDHLKATLAGLIQQPVEPHRLEQLALSVVGQCLYYRTGAGIIQVLIPPAELQAHFDIDSLSRHITSVMLAATQGGTSISQYKQMTHLLHD